MVFGLISLAATVPLLATSTIQLQEQSQKTKDDREGELKHEKCLLLARTSPRLSAHRREQLNNAIVVLHEGRLFLERQSTSDKHPFTGYFLPYPNTGYDGLVTTINAENMLNWVFIDRQTYQVRYGVRAESQSQLTGPMSLLLGENQEEWLLIFQERQGFVAVEESDGIWALYFDKDDDSLKVKAAGKAVVELELVRFGIEGKQSGKEVMTYSTDIAPKTSGRSEPVQRKEITQRQEPAQPQAPVELHAPMQREEPAGENDGEEF